ncbi:MAG: single-stranded DNA-binding protein [Bacteroidales bacterium]|nr:single-stranded DNA-binding protein [Bacteroidales bacterium]
MAGLNRVILVGRIGKEPETYSFEDGTKKISFSLATTESYRDKSTGEWKDITDWHNIVGYRYLAERNLAKGDLIYVEGKIKTRKYTDKEGNNRYLTEIVAERFNMLSKYQPSEGNYPGGGQKPAAPDAPPPAAKPETSPEKAEPEDDLPF